MRKITFKMAVVITDELAAARTASDMFEGLLGDLKDFVPGSRATVPLDSRDRADGLVQLEVEIMSNEEVQL